MASVPNTTTFTLQDVVDAVGPITNDLVDCIANAADENYDPLYWTTPATSLLEFRNYNSIANTFIGGVGATSVTSIAALANKTSLAESDIRDFVIDSNNNVSCYIKDNYSINASAFTNDDALTYYIDEKGRCTRINTNVFHATSPVRDIILVFPNVNSCNLDLISGGGAGTKQRTDVCCFPLLRPIGADASTNTSNFDHLICVSNVYVHIDNETNNGGSPDADISSAIASNIGAFISYSSNSNKPDEAVLETIGSTNSSVALEWAAISHSNSIDHYLIFFDGIYFGKTSGTALDVTGLAPSTSYDFKVLTIDSEGNTSPFISVHTESTEA